MYIYRVQNLKYTIAFIFVVFFFSPKLKAMDQDLILKTLPAIAEALSKKEGEVSKENKIKKIKHPTLINQSEINKCTQYTCIQLGSFGCDTILELNQVKSICKKHESVDCVKYSCERLGSFGCDSFYKIEQVIHSCKGVKETSCLDYTCKLLGSFACKTSAEVSQVASLCQGIETSCLRSQCKQQGSFSCDSFGEISYIAKVCKK